MRSNVFKLSAITATIAASFGAHAAVYNVYPYEPQAADAKTFGVAIQPSADGISCWSTNNCNLSTDPEFHEDKQKIAFEEQVYNQGFSYRDESPFRLANGYEYLNQGEPGFDDYCRDLLRYEDSACDEWAAEQYSRGYGNEGAGNNSIAYIESYLDKVTNKDNVVVNSFTDGADTALGNFYGGSLTDRSYGYINGSDTPIDRELSGTTYVQSKVFAKDDTYFVGSVTKPQGSNGDYISYAALWNNSGDLVDIYAHSKETNNRWMAQGSLRDVVTFSSAKYIVGYTSDNEPRPVASVFKIDTPTNSLSLVGQVSRFSDNSYASSILTSANKNGLAIGEVKYATGLERAYPNALFYISDLTDPNDSYNTFSGSIFFSGANGKAGAINNNNEVVGQIDYSRLAEIEGTERDRRAFATVIVDKTKSNAPFKNGAYYLDDLTNGDNALASNNDFRIIDATDINDAGVISGTAQYCAGGYSSEAINASCSQALSLVAVKLVPIQNADSSKIQPRTVESTSISRSGGSLGWLALGLLTMLGFRRKQ
ncbi:DUF3466 family protein [Vibrio rhodolitus]|uniref:DUF3466 family protein n=1 Tax=Vibrio rhodolitus TaxID=2231649 RepID=UPI000E0A3DA3|nr:DUF3466 family protein [Vibrio rhodolitus]